MSENEKTEGEETESTSAAAGEDARTRALEKELAVLKDQLQRSLADFQNFRRQSEKRVQDVRVFVQKEIFSQVLPVIDHLEAAIVAMQKQTDITAVVSGLKLVHEMAVKMLGDNKLETIKSTGEIFNPSLHEAVASVPTKDIEPNRIMFEAQRGYKIGDVVVRYAKVGVAVAPENADA